MGFKRGPKIFRLEFEDPDLNGLTVRARSLPLGEFIDLANIDTVTAAQTDRVIRLFASCLVEWNLENEFGDPVPATYEGILAQELDFMIQIISAWMEAIGSVAPPLPDGSNAGATSRVQSLPMES